MQELIKLSSDANGNSVVSARELYRFLELEKNQVSRWLSKNIVLNPYFQENIDWVAFDINVKGNHVKDYAISIDMSKKLAMASKSKKGNQVRDYFLECESIAKATTSKITIPSYQIENPIDRAKAWIIEQEKIVLLQEKNDKLQYRSDFVDICFDADGVFKFDEVAKILKLGYGSITLYEKMREYGLIMKGSTIPYQKFVNNGYFKVVEQLVESGNFKKLIATTYATQKGIGCIKKLLDTNG
jgi:anti-repressor protein